jgi:undecaprenyl-diphosphatase
MDRLIDLDKQLLLAINHWTSPWADQLMTTMSKVSIWFPLYILVAIAVFIPKSYSRRSLLSREGCSVKIWKAGLAAVVSVLVCYIFTDHLSHIIRNAVCRPRPGLDPVIGSQVRLISEAGGPYGFFSGHAANTIGFALLTSLILRRRIWTAVSMIWALLVCYSRSYLGHHYPIDVLTGIFCGIIFADACYWLYKFLMRLIILRAGSSRQDPS